MTWLQHWTDVLFLHYRIAPEKIAARLPPQLQVDTYDGAAWLSYVFFRLKLRPAWLPFVPGFSSLAELNVRTYVRYRGQPGIYFLQMFADNRLAIWASKWLTPLCYELATMSNVRKADGSTHLEFRPLASKAMLLSVDFKTSVAASELPIGSLNSWLLERYRLFVAGADGRIVFGDVEHPRWKAAIVQPAAVQNGINASLGIASADCPALVHHSPGVTARFLPFEVAAPMPGVPAQATQFAR